MSVGVCLKWVDRRPEIANGIAAATDERFAGLSPADQSALELAVRAGEQWGLDTVAVTVGPEPAAAALREAFAAGIGRGVHIVAPSTLESAVVARIAAPLLRGCRAVFCGDYSLDRGSGSMPAFLAAELGAAQLLGLVEVTLEADGAVAAVRRLDGGRRERLHSTSASVLSVEGHVAALRRAGLAATMRSANQPIEQVVPAFEQHEPHRFVQPYRPRARVLPPPSGDSALERIGVLTDAGGPPKRNEVVVLSPGEAAHRILETLAEWGHPSR